MAKFERALKGQLDVIINRIHQDIMQSAVSMKLVDESNYTIENTKIAVRVYDKYYMRSGSRASLSLTVVSHGDEVYVSAIGAGGGLGIFMNFSWGSEKNLVAVVEESIRKLGG